ncbi:MAG: hypothetical protein U9Q69_02790 [Nanoarchaeota archaeon]|nr:hypothetical protein [Nanoarchaeota archaeon]
MVKFSIIISLILAFFGIALLGRGITGLYFLDFDLPPCQTDNNCLEVCCQFYNEDHGVCDKEENCKAIYDLTHEEYLRMSNLEVESSIIAGKMYSVVKAHKESPSQQTHFNSMIVGLVLLLFAVIGLMIKEDIRKK